jgi:hypothetical protein
MLSIFAIVRDVGKSFKSVIYHWLFVDLEGRPPVFALLPFLFVRCSCMQVTSSDITRMKYPTIKF